ncbi:hypothetical protein BKA70DRAFT_1291733 [Coprinopsis sp. MPI-PUGE-AT-0042]|nr:hypothetical protein BKA70DRAFT_1291733 [Coprinopsis sp. MPI-PUGE-AT-0042]
MQSHSVPPSASEAALAAARSGDISGLEQLSSIIDTDSGSRYVSEALEIYLSFLHTSMVPNFSDIHRGNPAALHHANRGVNSLVGLQKVIRNICTSHLSKEEHLRAKVAASLVQNLDHIVAWCQFYLDPSSYIHPNVPPGARRAAFIDQFGSFVYIFATFSPALDDSLWINNGIQDLIVDTWLVRNGDLDPSDLARLPEFKKDDYFLNTVENASQANPFICSILSIMREALSRDTVRPKMMDKLFRRLESDGKGRTNSHVQLSKSILSRIEQLQSRVESGRYPAVYSYKSLGLLCDIAKVLTGSSGYDVVRAGLAAYDPLASSVDCRRLYHALYKGGYIGLVTAATLSISKRARIEDTPIPSIRSDSPTTFLAANMVTCHLLTKLNPEPAAHHKRRYLSVLENGGLEVLANAASVWHNSHPSFRVAKADREFDFTVVFQPLFTFYLNASCHPSSVYATHRAFHRLSPDHRRSLDKSCLAAAGKVQQHYPESDARHTWVAEFKRQLSRWVDLFTEFRRSWRSMLCDSGTTLALPGRRRGYRISVESS